MDPPGSKSGEEIERPNHRRRLEEEGDPETLMVIEVDRKEVMELELQRVPIRLSFNPVKRGYTRERRRRVKRKAIFAQDLLRIYVKFFDLNRSGGIYTNTQGDGICWTGQRLN